MHAQQLSLDLIARPRAQAPSRRAALRERANTAYVTAKRAWFRERSREMGGYTSRTRDQIDAECEMKAREAAEAVYFAVGYTRCSDPLGGGCDRLASPNYSVCPNCGD